MTKSYDIDIQPSARVPTTKDLLSPNKYKVVINRFPKVNYFVQRLPLPDVYIGTNYVPTNTFADMKYPGDKVEFGDLILSFLMDENLEGYNEIYEWMRSCTSDELAEKNDLFSTISVMTLTNKSNKNKTFTFYACYPQTISGVLLDVTQTEDSPLNVDCVFKFQYFDIT